MDKDIFDRVVENLKNARDKEGKPLAMASLIMSQRGVGDSLRYDFAESIEASDLRSISKVALCMTVGIAISEGTRLWGKLLSLETPIFPILEQYAIGSSPLQRKLLQKITIQHLLTNTMGHEAGFLFRKDIGNRDMNSLLSYIAETPINHEPGTHFSYSNVGPYLVSVLVQEEFGISLEDWVTEKLFLPAGIYHNGWKKYGDYTAGCSGLMMRTEDLHKLGGLLLNEGFVGTNSIVPKEWIRLMRTPFVRSPEKFEPHRALPKESYGLSLWITPTGNYYCDGTDGQYLIIVPSRDMVISTTGSQPDMKPITECMRFLL